MRAVAKVLGLKKAFTPPFSKSGTTTSKSFLPFPATHSAIHPRFCLEPDRSLPCATYGRVRGTSRCHREQRIDFLQRDGKSEVECELFHWNAYLSVLSVDHLGAICNKGYMLVSFVATKDREQGPERHKATQTNAPEETATARSDLHPRNGGMRRADQTSSGHHPYAKGEGRRGSSHDLNSRPRSTERK